MCFCCCCCMKRGIMLEEVALVGGLIAVQFVYAGTSVLLSYLMSLGITPFTIVTLSAFSTFLFLSPFAVCFERNKWPRKITTKLAIQLVLISFAGVTLFQSLFMKGIGLTSPAIATAMPNLAPGLIFIVAWTFRLEMVDPRCMHSKVKIIGTVLCVTGAVVMSILHSTSAQISAHSDSDQLELFDYNKIIGCLYLIAAVIVLSSNVVLQAATLGDFPAPISLCAITSLIGVVITMMVQFLEDHTLQNSWPPAGMRQLLAYSFLIGAVSGACVSFNGWAMKKRGPVLVSMFSPIATVLSAIFSAITLGDTISIGSLAGMCLMFVGLYFVLWAKGKETFKEGNASEHRSGRDEEKPLLS